MRSSTLILLATLSALALAACTSGGPGAVSRTVEGSIQLAELGETWEPTVPRPATTQPPPPNTRTRIATVVAGIPEDDSEIAIAEARGYETGVDVGDTITFDEAVRGGGNTVTATNVPWPPESGRCVSLPPYDDVYTTGSEVTVRDAGKDVLIGLGRLETGQILDGACVLRFEVELTETADFYEIKIGGQAPGRSFRYTQQELEDRKFAVSFVVED